MKKYINTFIFMFTFLMLSISPIKAVELPTVHLDKTVINFTDSSLNDTVNFTLSNTISQNAEVSFKMNASDTELVDTHNLNNKLSITKTYTNNETNFLSLVSAFTNKSGGSVKFTSEKATKAGEYVGRSTITMDDATIYPEGVYAKLYDTTSDGEGDTLVLNNYPNFTNDETLITDYDNQDSTESKKWASSYNDSDDIKKVKILNEIKPTKTVNWFQNMTNLTTIEGIEKINTSNVINMSGMFYNASKLTTLDLSNWDTSNVKSMSLMFDRMSSIQTLDLSKWDTSNVTNMGSMFSDCSSLTELDLSNWDTSNVTNMDSMFQSCANLTTIYADKGFKKSQVTEATTFMFVFDKKIVGGNGTKYNQYKFDKSYAILDLHSQKGYFTSKNKYTITYDLDGGDITTTVWKYYFKEDKDYNLPTPTKEGYTFIGWTGDNGTTPQKDVVIPSGTTGNKTYIANWKQDGVFAKLYDTTGDGKGDTLILNKHPYFTHEGTLITDYDDKDSMNERQWTSSADITKVKILDEIEPNSTKSWFQSLTNLTSIEGLEKLNTVNVTNMYNMFYNCKNIEEIDVSHFNTSKVTNMQGMFGECNKVKILDVSNWDTSNVENMSVMFQNAKALTTLDVSNFNTSKVKSMSCMFQNVTNLTTLDVSHFDTSNVESMGYMFYGDKSLTTLDVSNFDTSKTTTMIGMFKSVSSVTTLDVSNFNTSNVTNMYEMFRYMDNVEELKVDDFDTSKVTTMYAMFGSLANITSLNLSNWDTSNVTDMNSMFTMWDGRTDDWSTMTPKLETIIFGDKFDTSKVTNMVDMFSGQRTIEILDLYSFNTSSLEKATHMFNQTDNLKTIYAKDWDTSKLTDTSVMFWANSLKGGNGTEFSTSHTDESYARQDLHHQAGYFTSKDEYKITYNSDGGTLASDVWRRYFKEDLDYDIPTPTKSGYNFLGWTIGKNLYIRENTAFTSFGITTTTNSDNSYHFSGTYTGTERWFNLEDDKYKHTLSAGTYTLSTDLSSDFRLAIKLKKSNGSIHEFYTYKDNPVTFTIDGTEQYYMWISRVNNGQYYDMDVKIQLEEGKKNTSYESYISEPTLNISIPEGREGNRTYDAHYEEIIGVFSKLYDTTGDGKGDTLILNNTQNFTYEGTLIDDYENEDSTSIGQWTSSSDIKKVKILNEIKPTSTAEWFEDFTKLQEIEGLEKLNTSKVTDMSYMFYNCMSLTELDLSGWDTSNVTSMSTMFYGCEVLTILDVSGWDTSNVTDMSFMFSYCSKLTELDLSGWNTSNVTDMSYMFQAMSSLTELNLSNWDTSKVRTMLGMFTSCSSLITIYASSTFDTSNVTNSSNIFNNSNKLVGGNGTVYDANIIDKTYARIDTATTPGYFTAKN